MKDKIKENCKERGFHSYSFNDVDIGEENSQSMTIEIYCKDCNSRGFAVMDWNDVDNDEEIEE